MPRIAKPKLPEPIEADVQKEIVRFLRVMGITVMVHVAKGKLSHQQGFGKGFPDLMLIDRGHVTLLEVKRSKKHKPRPEQQAVHAMLETAGLHVIVAFDAQSAVSAVYDWRRGRCPFRYERTMVVRA